MEIIKSTSDQNDISEYHITESQSYCKSVFQNNSPTPNTSKLNLLMAQVISLENSNL